MFAESPSLPRKLPPLGRNGQQAPAADRPLQEAGSGMLGPSMPPEAAESTAYVENRHMGGMKGSAQSVLSAGSDETPSKFGESKHLGSGGDLDTPVVRPGRGLEREAGPPRRRRCMFFGYTLWAHAAGAICTSLALFYLGNLGSAFAAASAKGVSPLWPPPGLLLAVTLSYRRTAGAWAGMGALAYALLVDERGPWAAAFKVASEVTYPLLFLCIVDMLLGQSATTKWQRPPSATRSIAPFDSPKGVLAVCVAAAASSALAATWGAASLLLFEGLPSDLGWITWATWTVGDFSGAILLMPFLRAWAVAVVRQEPVAAAVDEFGEGLQEGSPSRCAAAVRMLGRACLAALRAVFAALCRSGRRIAPDHASHRSNVGIASTPSPTAFASRNRVERIEPHEADTSAAWLDTPRLRVLEAVIWMGATVFLSLVGSGLVVDFRGAASLGHVNDGDGASSLVYLTIPPALYGAFRFGVLGSTLATMTSAAAMLGATLAYGTPYSDALLLDAFLVVLSVTSLLVTALMSRLNGVMAKLRRTQRRLAAAREHAEETARSKVAFLANMSHELRTPLNGILGMSSVVVESGLPDEQLTCMEDVQTSARHLLDVLNDILLLAKMEFNNHTANAAKMQGGRQLDFLLSPQGIDLLQTVETSCAIAYDPSRHGHIQLVVRCSPEAPRFVVADSTRVKQVLCNLVSNALKFVERGEVDISVRLLEDREIDDELADQLRAARATSRSYLARAAAVAPPVGSGGVGKSPSSIKKEMPGRREYTAVSVADAGDTGTTDAQQYVKFSVRDTGIGIPPEKQPRVFEAFRQADNSVARRYGGTGLGLAISYRLVEAMGGVLALDSEVGVGSEFWFVLPLYRANDPFASRSVGTSSSSALLTPHASLADPICRSTCEVLRGQPAVVAHPNSCAAASIATWLRDVGMRVTILTCTAEVEVWATGLVGGEEKPAVAYVDTHFDVPERVLSRGAPAGLGLAGWLRETGLCAHVVHLVPRGDTRAPVAGSLSVVTSPIFPSAVQQAAIAVAEAMGGDGAGGKSKQVVSSHVAASNGAARLAPDSSTPKWNLRVLVAEDNVINQRVAAKMLQALGCEAVVAHDGSEALAQLGVGAAAGAGGTSDAVQTAFDVVLMDVQMPVLDGIAATRCIRKARCLNRRGSTLPIIALTANAFSSDREDCERAGMDEFVSKPFSRVTISAAIAAVLPDLVV